MGSDLCPARSQEAKLRLQWIRLAALQFREGALCPVFVVPSDSCLSFQWIQMGVVKYPLVHQTWQWKILYEWRFILMGNASINMGILIAMFDDTGG